MEALAVLRLRQEAERKRLEEETEKALRTSMSQEEIDQLNISFGFPHPAVNVCAIGKPGCAAVWWSYDQDESKIIGWEIHRYRRYINSKEWGHKGHLRIASVSKKQVLLENLTNGSEYRFGVRAINSEGTSGESVLSNTVVIESSLPTGWFRFFDDRKQKFFYANLKTQQSTWTRPDVDPDFLPEDIILNFTGVELKFLREIYDEDMHMFDKVTIERFVVMLKECGERIHLKEIKIAFKAFANVANTFAAHMSTKGADVHEHVAEEKKAEELRSWQQFMAVMLHFKKQKQRSSFFSDTSSGITMFFSRQLIARLKGSDMEKKKFGAWRETWNEVAERNVYSNSETGEVRYGMPDEVRFYLPPKMEDMLMKVFDYGHIENFKRQFSQIDVDSSGDISDREMRVLLNAMNVKIDEFKFKKLLRTVDLNGNGSIEFDEFCYLMYCLLGNESNSFWKDILPADGAIADASISGKSSQKSRKSESVSSAGDDDERSRSSIMSGSTLTPEYGRTAVDTRGILDAVDRAAQHVQNRAEDGSEFSSEDSETKSDVTESEHDIKDKKLFSRMPKFSLKAVQEVFYKFYDFVTFHGGRAAAKVNSANSFHTI